MEYTYQDIAKFIVSVEVDKSTVTCQFQTPNGGIVESSARIRRSNTMQGQIQRKVSRIASSQAKRTASRLFRKALGGGMLGRIGSSSVRILMTTENMGLNYTNAEKNQAVVDAFEKVANQFVDDLEAPPIEKKQNIKIRRKETLEKKKSDTKGKSRLETQLEKHPILTKFDKEVLARMLVDVADADGGISREELEFLADHLDTDTQSINHIRNMGPLSPIECQEVSRGVKDTIFLLAWIIALSDLELDPKEEALLLDYGDMLNIPSRRKQDWVQMAKFHTLEQHMSSDLPRDKVIALAGGLKMQEEDVELCWVRWKKKNA